MHLTCIHVREDTLIGDLFQLAQVSVRTRLDLGVQDNEIRQVLVETNRATVLRVVYQGFLTRAPTHRRCWRLSLGPGIIVLQSLRVGDLRLQVGLRRLHYVCRVNGVSGKNIDMTVIVLTYAVHSTQQCEHPCP